jgi:hypothetical protein
MHAGLLHNATTNDNPLREDRMLQMIQESEYSELTILRALACPQTFDRPQILEGSPSARPQVTSLQQNKFAHFLSP